MTFEQYIAECGRAYAFYGGTWRWGQTVFNVLAQVRPDISEVIRGSVLDPFYRDDIAHRAINKIQEMW